MQNSARTGRVFIVAGLVSLTGLVSSACRLVPERPLKTHALEENENLNPTNPNKPEKERSPESALPFIKTEGRLWQDESGKRIDLIGTNIGNWLQLEFWMMELSEQFHDQCRFEDHLTERFGRQEKDRLMNVFRDHWITERDWDLMADFGLNVIRLPFWYSIIEDETRPFTLRADAWHYLDWAIDQAEQRGMYVILDLHGAAGSQGWEHHSGCADRNELWGSQVYRDRTKWLWSEIAKRYKDRSAVAAYGLLNEPWGTDAQTLADFMVELYHVIRAVDSKHVIILPGHDRYGIDAYGQPRDRGMSNVAFEMHFYPGLFGWGQPGFQVHNDWLFCGPSGDTGVCEWSQRLQALDIAFFIGEFQPWTISANLGGPLGALSKRIYRNQGWATTNWAYKTVSWNGTSGNGSEHWPWGMVTNTADTGAMKPIDLKTASASEIENFFRSFATQALSQNEVLKTWMKKENRIPGRIEAQHFDWMAGVKSEATEDVDGAINIAHLDPGDWLSYNIYVEKSGWYDVQLRVASELNSGKLILGQDGKDLTPIIPIPNTGGWQNWRTISSEVYLQAGQQSLVLWAEDGGWNINWFSLSLRPEQ